MDSSTSMRTRQDMNAHIRKEAIQAAIQYMENLLGLFNHQGNTNFNPNGITHPSECLKWE